MPRGPHQLVQRHEGGGDGGLPLPIGRQLAQERRLARRLGGIEGLWLSAEVGARVEGIGAQVRGTKRVVVIVVPASGRRVAVRIVLVARSGGKLGLRVVGASDAGAERSDHAAELGTHVLLRELLGQQCGERRQWHPHGRRRPDRWSGGACPGRVERERAAGPHSEVDEKEPLCAALVELGRRAVEERVNLEGHLQLLEIERRRVRLAS